jgi:hypothetical protein
MDDESGPELESEHTERTAEEEHDDHGPSDSARRLNPGTTLVRPRIRAPDVASPAWPPPWLQLIAWLLTLGSALLVLHAILPTVDRILSFAADLGKTRPGQLLASPIATYIDRGTSNLSLKAKDILDAWLSCGVILFVLSIFGSTGARIGWLVFGAQATAMAWIGAQRGSAPISGGMAALTWSILSILALRRVALEPYEELPSSTPSAKIRQIRTRTLVRLLLGPPFLDPSSGYSPGLDSTTPDQYDEYSGYRMRPSELARGAAMQRRLDEAVKRNGFDTSESYIKAKWGKRRTFADELGAPEWFIRDLINAIFPPKPGHTVGRTPWQIREEAVSSYKAGEAAAAVARRYSIASGTVVRWARAEAQNQAPNEADDTDG